jgi:hypothetical protein
MLTLNNNSAKLDKFGFDNPASGQPIKSGEGGVSVLPSFHDILWCPDVDGDVMDTSGMGGAMVRVSTYLRRYSTEAGS